MREKDGLALATITYERPSFLRGMAGILDVFNSSDEQLRVRITIRDIDVNQLQRQNLAWAWRQAFRYLGDATSQVVEGLGFPVTEGDVDNPD